MKHLQSLVSGYKTFLDDEYKIHEKRYKMLAEKGQFPRVMLIGCCDSRVNPELIFHAAPGDLFVVRNVANLVPAYEPDSAYHGVGAALEFALTVLGIRHIVVMGHSHCGGVRACCEAVQNNKASGKFIPRWTCALDNCARGVIDENPNLPPEELHHKVELSAIKNSLKNLETFPFLLEYLKDERIQIHGAYFDIKNAQLYALDRTTKEFMPVE